MPTVQDVTVYAPSLQLDTGLSNSDRITSNGTAVTSVSEIIPGAYYEYSNDGGVTWINNYTYEGVEGVNTVIARYTSADGTQHSATSAPLIFTLDTTAPVAPVISVNGSATTNAATGLPPQKWRAFLID